MAKYQAIIGNKTSEITENDHKAVMQVINGSADCERIVVEYVYACGNDVAYTCTVGQYKESIS